MEAEVVLTPADLIAEWLRDYWPTTTLEVTENTIVINWPKIQAKNGLFVLSKLTVTLPERGIFKVDNVWICDPKFFDQLEIHMNGCYDRLKTDVDKAMMANV